MALQVVLQVVHQVLWAVLQVVPPVLWEEAVCSLQLNKWVV